jgi:hypothetical protein
MMVELGNGKQVSQLVFVVAMLTVLLKITRLDIVVVLVETDVLVDLTIIDVNGVLASIITIV